VTEIVNPVKYSICIINFRNLSSLLPTGKTLKDGP